MTLSISFAITHSCDYYLSQSDFDQGTVRIRNSGKYCVKEDIIFNPKPGSDSSPNAPGAWLPTNNALFPGSEDQRLGAFILGFFAAITIETNDVILDLQGCEIKWAFEFYLQQRWGSIIQIGNSGFLPNAGPGQFGEMASDFRNVNNIEIKNGFLGLSVHHGIHGNGASNIVIKDLVIRDFEVAGIQLNGFDGATIENVKIGPSFQRVPLTGYYSSARFLLLPLRQIFKALDDNYLSIPYITFDGARTLSLVEIVNNLVESMDLVFRVLTGDITENTYVNGIRVKYNPNYRAGKDLFINTLGLPDGSAIYGILANSKSVAVGGFGVSANEAADGEDLTIIDVVIKDLKMSANEIPVLYFDKCDGEMSTTRTIQRGPFTDVFDLRRVISEQDAELIDQHEMNPNILNNIRYIGNPLSDAQIALEEFRMVAGTDFGFRTQIDDRLISWAKGQTYFPSTCADFVCNTDIMFHTNKGIMGARIDGIEDVSISNLVIHDLVNESPLVSCACGSYKGSEDGGGPGQEDDEGGMGTDIRGIIISRGDVEFYGSKSSISGLNSFFGDVTGIDIINGAIVDYDIGSDVSISNIKSASKLSVYDLYALLRLKKTPFPNNFDLCMVEIEDTSQVMGDVPINKDRSDCIDGFDVILNQIGKDKPMQRPRPGPVKKPSQRYRDDGDDTNRNKRWNTRFRVDSSESDSSSGGGGYTRRYRQYSSS